jgi:glutamine synthetase
VEAVDRYALLLRSSAAKAGNDHRLGANEAPPAVISVFFGGLLTEILDNIAEGKAGPKSVTGETITLGVTSLPSLPKDASDRNRTSPFAFTGNKFEFRMAGASQSIATVNTYLNVAVAQVLCEFADKLEALPGGSAASDRNRAIEAIIKESYGRHRRVVFNGNGYSDEWLREAESRGLPNVRNTVDALPVLINDETIALFEKHKVLTKEEMESRYQIYMETYSRQINIEAGVSVDLARRFIFPAVSAYAASLARDASSLLNAGAHNAPQTRQARHIAEILAGLDSDIAALENLLGEAQNIEDIPVQARAYLEKVRPAMEQVRGKVDMLEKITPKEVWPLPGYEDLLFKL